MTDCKCIFKRAFKDSICVLLFLALIRPFGVSIQKDGTFIDPLLTFFSVSLSLLVTKFILGDYEKRNSSLRSFLVHETVFYIVNIPILASLLVAHHSYHGWFCKGPFGENSNIDGHSTLSNVLLMCLNVAIVGVFFFLRSFYEFRSNKLCRELDDVKTINALLEKRHKELLLEKKDGGEVRKRPVTVVIEGLRQEARLEVDPSNILYAESKANYADICYVSENETRHFSLRVSLKQIKEILSDFEYIVQCHRSFLVNVNFIESMTALGSVYQLQLFRVEKQLPVSRTNSDVIKAALSEK